MACTACRYGLELIQVSGSIQHALSLLKSSHPQLKAVCMGTRHTDPYSSDLKPFSPTDGDWPDYMRVNCILVSCWIEVTEMEFLCCKRDTTEMRIPCKWDEGYYAWSRLHKELYEVPLGMGTPPL